MPCRPAFFKDLFYLIYIKYRNKIIGSIKNSAAHTEFYPGEKAVKTTHEAAVEDLHDAVSVQVFRALRTFDFDENVI
jgi:hypothetical protein